MYDLGSCTMLKIWLYVATVLDITEPLYSRQINQYSHGQQEPTANVVKSPVSQQEPAEVVKSPVSHQFTPSSVITHQQLRKHGYFMSNLCSPSMFCSYKS